jgi:tryptophanyl-tRNA synthetase
VLEPIWEKRKHFLEKPDYLEDIIASGSKKAGKTASETMRNARKAMNLS